MSRKPGTQSTGTVSGAAGYGQPPRHSQFRKGQSGNPLGRPRKSMPEGNGTSQAESHGAIMSRLLSTPVKVNANGKAKLIPKAEALQRAQEKQALVEGKVQPTRSLKRELRELDAQKQKEIAADHAAWKEYIHNLHTLKWRLANNSEPMKCFWIEPEDISFVPGELVHIRGPRCPDDVAGHLVIQRLQQACMASWLHETLTARGPVDDLQQYQSMVAINLLWSLISRFLSSRMAAESEVYRTRLEQQAQIELFMCRSPRSLAQEVKRSWAALGRPPPQVVPPHAIITKLKPLLRQVERDVRSDPLQTLLYGHLFPAICGKPGRGPSSKRHSHDNLAP